MKSGASLDKCPSFEETVVQVFPEVKAIAASFE